LGKKKKNTKKQKVSGYNSGEDLSSCSSSERKRKDILGVQFYRQRKSKRKVTTDT
jgi:hypothetical protein